jgi:hypothetical protein
MGGASKQVPIHGKRRPGRPPVHDEAWTKVTVVLFDRQIGFLDRLTASMRLRNGRAVSRAQLIRAFVDSIDEANLDLTALASERDLKQALVERLTRPRSQGAHAPEDLPVQGKRQGDHHDRNQDGGRPE